MNYQLLKDMLDRTSKFVGVNNRMGKLINNYAKLCEANHLSSHFSHFLKPIVAKDDEEAIVSLQPRQCCSGSTKLNIDNEEITFEELFEKCKEESC